MVPGSGADVCRIYCCNFSPYMSSVSRADADTWSIARLAALWRLLLSHRLTIPETHGTRSRQKRIACRAGKQAPGRAGRVFPFFRTGENTAAEAGFASPWAGADNYSGQRLPESPKRLSGPVDIVNQIRSCGAREITWNLRFAQWGFTEPREARSASLRPHYPD